MTMPERIWYGKDPVYGTLDKVWKPDDVKRLKGKEPRGSDWQGITPYIRADLADTLAKALEDALTNGCSVDTLEALDRYKALDTSASSV